MNTVHISMARSLWCYSTLVGYSETKKYCMLDMYLAYNVSYRGTNVLRRWLTQQGNTLLWGHARRFGYDLSLW